MRALHAKGPKFRLFRPRPASGTHVVAPALMVEKRLMATPIGEMAQNVLVAAVAMGEGRAERSTVGVLTVAVVGAARSMGTTAENVVT